MPLTTKTVVICDHNPERSLIIDPDNHPKTKGKKRVNAALLNIVIQSQGWLVLSSNGKTRYLSPQSVEELQLGGLLASNDEEVEDSEDLADFEADDEEVEDFAEV